MPSGIQVWDQNGALVFDETSPVVKFLGTASIGSSYTGEAKTGTIVDGRFTAYPGHTPFFARIDGGFDTGYFDATISIDGNTLTWTFPREVVYYNGYMYNRPNQTFIYGIL